jgi:hypothetical protein
MTAATTDETTEVTDETTGATAAKRGTESGLTSNEAVAATSGLSVTRRVDGRERGRIADRESRTAETTRTRHFSRKIVSSI